MLSLGEDLREAVAATINREDVREAVAAIYATVEGELGRLSPRCEMSGRCCRFEEYGHRLFVTTAELATFAADLRRDQQLTPYLLRQDDGGCRFQQMKLCRVHRIRPLGCRLFYCDKTREQELQVLFERMHARLKKLHDELDVPYFYIEWRKGLNAIAPLLE